jgi:hypothetical protein
MPMQPAQAPIQGEYDRQKNDEIDGVEQHRDLPLQPAAKDGRSATWVKLKFQEEPS